MFRRFPKLPYYSYSKFLLENKKATRIERRTALKKILDIVYDKHKNINEIKQSELVFTSNRVN